MKGRKIIIVSTFILLISISLGVTWTVLNKSTKKIPTVSSDTKAVTSTIASKTELPSQIKAKGATTVPSTKSKTTAKTGSAAKTEAIAKTEATAKTKVTAKTKTTPKTQTIAKTKTITTVNTPKATAKTTSSPTSLSLTGIIIDEDCIVNYTRPGDDAGEDTKICLEMPTCATSGYGIAVRQSNNTYKFYYFDGAFATLNGKIFKNGSGSQLTSWNLVHNTKKKDHVTVAVTGIVNGNTKVSPYDGISYLVLTVSSLSEK